MSNNLNKVNQIIRNHRGLNQRGRVKVLYSHMDLINYLRNKADSIDYATDTEGYNYYLKLISKFNDWVINGKDDRSKDYKVKLKNENPSEIKPNMKTNNRIYHGRSNYYTKSSLKPTKDELKNPDIKQNVINLKWLRYDLKHKNHNQFKISRIIRQTKDDLKETIKNYRGINHQGNVKNEPTPIPQQQNHEVHDPMVKLLIDGYSEKEIAQFKNISPSAVTQHLHGLIKN